MNISIPKQRDILELIRKLIPYMNDEELEFLLVCLHKIVDRLEKEVSDDNA